MAFGQPSGPPASRRQVETLLQLLNDAGHIDFRDARGPMGFTQRQAGGRFTRDEADEFIAQLEATADGPPEDSTPRPTQARTAAANRSPSLERRLRSFTDQQLAAELQRRGWIVVEP